MTARSKTPLDGVEITAGVAAAAAREADEQYRAKRRAAYGFTQTRIPTSMNTIDARYGDVPGAGERIWPLLPPFIADYGLTELKEQGYGADDLYHIVDLGLEGLGDKLLVGVESMGSKVLDAIGSLFGKEPDEIDTLPELRAHLLERFAHHKYHFIDEPTPTLEHWLIDDDEFARQRLAGVNPTLLTRYTANGDALDALLAGLDGDVLARARAAHAMDALFWVDYGARLRPVTYTVEGESLATQAVAFFAREGDRLMPVTIRLEDDGPWFTPGDGFAWLLAKLHATNAETQDQGMRAHLMCTHLLHETMAIATERAFSERHPLRLLLMPHLRYTITINELARKMMINQGGNIDKVNSGGRLATFQQVNFAYRRMQIGDLALPTDIVTRGVGVDALPIEYAFRDDGLVMWGALSAFCRELVASYYADDAAVEADSQIAFWTGELAEQLNRGAADAPDLFDSDAVFEGRAERFPARITTRDALVEMVTNIIFGASFQHAAVNNPQFKMFGYVPNGPLLMRSPPPRTRKVSAQDVIDALPDVQQAVFQLSFMLQLTATSENTVLRPDADNVSYLLGLYGFVDPAAQAAVKAHAGRMGAAMETVRANGARRAAAFRATHPDAETVPYSVSYPFLDPTTVDNCIQI